MLRESLGDWSNVSELVSCTSSHRIGKQIQAGFKNKNPENSNVFKNGILGGQALKTEENGIVQLTGLESFERRGDGLVSKACMKDCCFTWMNKLFQEDTRGSRESTKI